MLKKSSCLKKFLLKQINIDSNYNVNVTLCVRYMHQWGPMAKHTAEVERRLHIAY